MFIKLTDKNGEMFVVNTMHVVEVRPAKSGGGSKLLLNAESAEGVRRLVSVQEAPQEILEIVNR